LIEVIAMHTDIQLTNRHRLSPNARQQVSQSFRQNHAPTLYSNQDHLLAVFVTFGNFMRNAPHGTLNGVGVKNVGGIRHVFSSNQ
jgi:hypothetical protein